MKRAAFLLFLTGLLLAGCYGESPLMIPSIQNNEILSRKMEWSLPDASGTVSPTETPPAEDNSASLIPYTVLYESNGVLPAMYEPEAGCYLGAMLSPNEPEETALTSFTDSVQKKHAVFTYNMKLGEAFPETWMLNCVAAQAVPMIFLRPAGSGSVFSAGELTETAMAFGAYHIPLFIVFYPLTEGHSYDAATYTLYYRYARVIFAEYAPQAAFVWLADINISEADAAAWYPGHEAVDWVGLSVIARPEQDDHGTHFTEEITAFYNRYQKDKPIMLAPLAISHLSANDYVYHTRAAVTELEQLYTAVRDVYPRIKLISYMNINGLEDEDTSLYQDDFSITGDDTLLNAYRQFIKDRYFLSDIETKKEERAMWLRSSYDGYLLDGQTYLDINILTQELKKSASGETMLLGENRYADIRTLENDNDIFITVDHTHRLIHIYKKVTVAG